MGNMVRAAVTKSCHGCGEEESRRYLCSVSPAMRVAARTVLCSEPERKARAMEVSQYSPGKKGLLR